METVAERLNLPTTRALPAPRPAAPRANNGRHRPHPLYVCDEKIDAEPAEANQTLEAEWRARCSESWFVDFDPVRAKAEGRDPACPGPLPTCSPTPSRTPDVGENSEGSGPFGRIGELQSG